MMVARDREWNEGAARTRLLQMFEAIGLEDPWVAATRRKLSTRAVRLRRMGQDSRAVRLSIFPLTGALLFPGLQLPLHIFEPRYRSMISDALVRDRRIAMIQPQGPGEGAPLFSVGCVGKIGEVEAMEDGRYNVVLEGISRFRMLRELDVTTPFRQIEGRADRG